MKVDKSTINLINQKNVLNVIRNNEGINRAKIASYTALSLPTVMKITNTLIELGLVREIGKGKSSGGKPPKLLEFIGDSYYIVGVDLGSNKITAILTDLNAEIYYEHIEKIKITESVERIIEKIIYSINTVINQSNIQVSRILGIGLGVPGIIDPDKGVVKFSPDFGWENINLVEIIKKRFGMIVQMDNVNRTMAIGEKLYGLGRDVDNFICINLGYGIGAASCINGEIAMGCCGSAGEFGHMIVEPQGPICDCGNHGCIEALASSNALVKEARRRAKADVNYSILEVAGDLESISAKLIFDLAKANNRDAEELIDTIIGYLAIGISNLINFLDPELIILEGGVAKAGDFLLDKINERLIKSKMKCAGEKTQLVISQLGDYAAAIGSTAMIMDRFIESAGEVDILNH